MITDRIKNSIRDIKDFPKPGIIFKDITPIFYDQDLCGGIIEEFVKRLSNTKIDAVMGIESRGFLFGLLLANKLGLPFIMVRKPGKLPYKTHSFEYELEYGNSKIEVHTDAIKPEWNVLIHDDLLATGGTATAASELVKMQNAYVSGYAFLVELAFLKGKSNLTAYSENIISLVKYE